MYKSHVKEITKISATESFTIQNGILDNTHYMYFIFYVCPTLSFIFFMVFMGVVTVCYFHFLILQVEKTNLKFCQSAIHKFMFSCIFPCKTCSSILTV